MAALNEHGGFGFDISHLLNTKNKKGPALPPGLLQM
jgi:hypothetical protein